MADFALLKEFLDAFKTAWEAGGGIATLATCVLFAIRTMRTQLVQNMLPPGLQWMAWPAWLKWLVPFVLALLGTVLYDVNLGLTPWEAVANAFAAAVAATAGHSLTKAAGQAEQGVRLRRDPMYQPGLVRKAASVVLPIRKATEYYQGKR